jgi:ferredoxin
MVETQRSMNHAHRKASTRSFLEEARRTPGFSFLDTLHGYIYMRWAYTYIAIGLGEHRLNRLIKAIQSIFRWGSQTNSKRSNGQGSLADVYHGKVLTTNAARQLVTVKEDIRLTDLERVIPYPYARDIILNNPDHIVLLQCPCRSSRAEPCLPLDVCLVVGEPFASFIATHHPQKTRWITADEACALLETEHKRGRVHQAFFKDATLGRFYVICNCCACCCGAMQAMRNGIPLLAESGYTCRVETAICVGCGECVEWCSFGVLDIVADSVMVDDERCMGCGVCITACEHEAIALVRDPCKSEPLEIVDILHWADKEESRSRMVA